MSIKHRGGMGHNIIISYITSENFRSWCCHVGISHHTNMLLYLWISTESCKSAGNKMLWHSIYLLIFIYYHRDPQIFQKYRSHLQILGTRKVIWSKSHTKNSQFWRDQWTSPLSGALCSTHVSRYTFLVLEETKLQQLWWPH